MSVSLLFAKTLPERAHAKDTDLKNVTQAKGQSKAKAETKAREALTKKQAKNRAKLAGNMESSQGHGRAL